MEIDEFPASNSKNMENHANCSLPTPAQRTNNQQKQSKITLTDHSKKMVWGELGKIKSIRQTISKAHFLATDIMQAKSKEKILPAFSVHKSIPLLPGGKPSWAFQVEWEKTLAECSQNLMALTSAYLLKGNQYTEIYADMTSETVNLVKKQLCLMLCDESIDQNTYDYLYPKERKIRTPHCYFLPKIHKITLADLVFVGRNIVSNCGGPCEKIGKFIDFFLVPFLQNQYTGQIQNLRFCDGRNLAHIFSCPEFPVVRLDTMSGFSEWTANVLS